MLLRFVMNLLRRNYNRVINHILYTACKLCQYYGSGCVCVSSQGRWRFELRSSTTFSGLLTAEY